MLPTLEFRDAASVVATAPGGGRVRSGYHVRLAGRRLAPSLLTASGLSVRAEFREPEGLAASIDDSFAFAGGLVLVNRRWTLFRPGPWILEASFAAALGDGDIFVPAALYRGNAMGKGAFPTRRESGAWSFLETRSPLPACVQLHDGRSSFVFAAEPAADIAHLASAEGRLGGGEGEVSVEIPGLERPWAYTGKTARERPSEDPARGLSFAEGGLPAAVQRRFYYALADSSDRPSSAAYRDFVEDLARAGSPGGRPVSRAETAPGAGAVPGEGAAPTGSPSIGWEEYEARKTAHLLSLVERAPDGESAYLAMGRRNGGLQSIYDYTAGSFLVKSLEGALVLARSPYPGSLAAPQVERLAGLFGLERGPGLLVDLAERIGRFFLAGEREPGVHQDCCDPAKGVWGGYLGISEHDDFRLQVNARCNGEVMKAYVRLYEELRARGREVPEFIELPRRVARFYLDRQLGGAGGGSFGRWWSVEGEPINTLGTNGAYVASFLAALEPHFEEGGRLASGLERAGAYYGGLAERGEFFGDTLDADSCDKEAGVALLALFLDLYERDGKRAWLDRAGEAADFVLSWVWQYDCPFPPDSPLGLRRFSTRGMTSVSVAHHHLDFYGMTIAYDFLRYAERSGQAFYRAQAELMLRSCLQLVAGPGDYLGRSAEDLGWQPEQINHTEWDYFDRPDRRAGHFDIDIAWVAVLGLGAYQRIRSRYPEALARAERGE